MPTRFRKPAKRPSPFTESLLSSSVIGAHSYARHDCTGRQFRAETLHAIPDRKSRVCQGRRSQSGQPASYIMLFSLSGQSRNRCKTIERPDRKERNSSMATSIDTLRERARRMRVSSIKATTQAGSGHPSSCLSAADLTAVLFFQEMRYDPSDPHNRANDRFVLSKGHAAPLLWAAFAEAGIVDESAPMTLRRFDSPLEGHPTPRMPWVDIATGSLGQGLSAALGIALAARLDGADSDTFALLGDGECAEGSVWEAAALAGALPDLEPVRDRRRQRTRPESADHVRIRRRPLRGHLQGFRMVRGGQWTDTITKRFRRRSRNAVRRVGTGRVPSSQGRSREWAFRCSKHKDNWHGKPVPEKDLEAVLEELSQPYACNGFKPASRPNVSVPSGPESHSVTVTRERGSETATREAYGDALAKLRRQRSQDRRAGWRYQELDFFAESPREPSRKLL